MKALLRRTDRIAGLVSLTTMLSPTWMMAGSPTPTGSGSSTTTAPRSSGSPAPTLPGDRSSICVRKGEGYYGYKVHAAVCATTGLPVA